jgi:tRNA dimethylallyltransferase
MIDIVDPADRYSAARFVDDATRCIDEIAGRGALALLVGGTMLYFRALFEGLDAMPGADEHVRASLDRDAAERGWPALHADLAGIDPPTAARLSPNDGQRIQRALEVHRLSGRPLSSWHAEKTLSTPPPLVSLEPRDRGWLHVRIGERFRAMLDAGLVDEVRHLRARGDLDALTPSMRAVGYRQAWAALDAGDLSTLAERGSAATRQLAKRQLTWLRAMPWRQVVACDDVGATAEVVRAARRLVA